VRAGSPQPCQRIPRIQVWLPVSSRRGRIPRLEGVIGEMDRLCGAGRRGRGAVEVSLALSPGAPSRIPARPLGPPEGVHAPERLPAVHVHLGQPGAELGGG
jgi:hypothetical protein